MSAPLHFHQSESQHQAKNWPQDELLHGRFDGQVLVEGDICVDKRKEMIVDIVRILKGLDFGWNKVVKQKGEFVLVYRPHFGGDVRLYLALEKRASDQCVTCPVAFTVTVIESDASNQIFNFFLSHQLTPLSSPPPAAKHTAMNIPKVKKPICPALLPNL